MLLLLLLHQNFFRKRRNAFTWCVSRHSDFDTLVAEIQFPLNFGWSLLSMYASASFSTSDFFRKRWKTLTRWVSRHSNFDAPIAEIQFPLNFEWSLLSMYASATCSTSYFLSQTAKRFESMSFKAFRLRCTVCRNSVAFEFRVIPLEHVCFC